MRSSVSLAGAQYARTDKEWTGPKHASVSDIQKLVAAHVDGAAFSGKFSTQLATCQISLARLFAAGRPILHAPSLAHQPPDPISATAIGSQCRQGVCCSLCSGKEKGRQSMFPACSDRAGSDQVTLSVHTLLRSAGFVVCTSKPPSFGACFPPPRCRLLLVRANSSSLDRGR